MPRTSPLPTLDTAMLALREADADLAAGILRTERAARTAYDADTLILLRRARRNLREARTLCAAIHPNGIPNWQPPPACPDDQEE
jgi:hypothetical protein